jgi:hypothetical protein
MGVYRMTGGNIFRRRADFSDSNVKDCLGDVLTDIRDADEHMTDAKLGRILGKGADSAGNYRVANTEMGVSTFVRGVAEWGERFGNPAMALAGFELRRIHPPQPTTTDAKIAKLATTIATLSQLSAGSLTEQQRRALGNHIDDLRLIADELAAGVVA